MKFRSRRKRRPGSQGAADLTLNVTARNIACGVARWGPTCPIALAARQLPDVTSARVGKSSIRLTFLGTRSWDYDLPDEAMAFVAAFDNGRAVSPFTFALQTSYYRPRQRH